MNKTIVSSGGETWGDLSRRFYGSENEANTLALANPHATQPLGAGINITIPQLTPEPETFIPDTQTVYAVIVNDLSFRFWADLTLVQGVDSFSAVSFSAPMDFQNAELLRSAFVPFSFADVKIKRGSELVFSGYIVNVVPQLTEDRKSLKISCYSRSAILSNCTFPASLFTLGSGLEFSNQSVKEISSTLCKPLGIRTAFSDSPGKAFQRVSCNPDENALQFLSKLAAQRNFVISDNPQGNVLFRRSVSTGNPVGRIYQGEFAYLVNITPDFNPQEFYSVVTGLAPFQPGSNGGSYTKKNNFLNNVVIPLTFDAKDSDGTDAQTIVNTKFGRMIGNAIQYKMTLSGQFAPDGDFWRPNTTVVVHAHDAMIYRETEFLIRSVEYNISENQQLTILTLVLPETFSGGVPENLPWLV